MPHAILPDDLETAAHLEAAFARYGARDASVELLSHGQDPALAERFDGGVADALAFCFDVRAQRLCTEVADHLAVFDLSEVSPSAEDCADVLERCSRTAWDGTWPVVSAEWSALVLRYPALGATRERAEHEAVGSLRDVLRRHAALPQALAKRLALAALSVAALPGAIGELGAKLSESVVADLRSAARPGLTGA